MYWPLARFVDTIGSTNVRLDLNDGVLRVGQETKSEAFGQPEWEAEPGQAGGEDGYRTTSLQIICGHNKTEAAAAFKRLAIELQRPTSFLMWQDSPASEPRWIRCYRSQLPVMSYEYVGVDDDPDGGTDAWLVTLNLDSDPFAYGAPITLTGSILNRPDKLPRATTAVNHCPNPSFEVSASGWGGGVVTGTTLQVAGVNAYGLPEPATTWTWVTDTTGDLDLTGSETPGPWTLSAYTTAQLQDTCTVTLTVTWLDSSGQELATATTDPTPVIGGAATRLVLTNTPPEDAWHGRVSVTGQAENPVTPMLDAVMFEQSDTVSDYADGNSAGWAWTDTPGLSTSGPATKDAGLPAHAVLPATLLEGDGPAETVIRIMPDQSWHVAEPLLQLTCFEAPGTDVAPIVLSVTADTASSGFTYSDSGYRWIDVPEDWTWGALDPELTWDDV